MKSHLIPEPQPLENHHVENQARKLFLEREQAGKPQHNRPDDARADEYHRYNDTNMRGFLRTVFVC